MISTEKGPSTLQSRCAQMFSELPVSVKAGVYGVGVDIASNDRLQLAVERSGERFLHYVYTQDEIDYCFAAEYPYQRFAACWAVKEAAVKALGTGFNQSIGFKNIEFSPRADQKPHVIFNGRFKSFMEEEGINYSAISISHEDSKAVAIVVLCRV